MYKTRIHAHYLKINEYVFCTVITPYKPRYLLWKFILISYTYHELHIRNNTLSESVLLPVSEPVSWLCVASQSLKACICASYEKVLKANTF